MDKKSNMKQAMFEMFGVGSDQNEKPVQSVKEEPKHEAAAEPVKKSVDKVTVAPVQKPVDQVAAVPREKPAASFLAPGTVLEGTLRSVGDVEISGSFKGDISTEGTVILRSNIQGNVTASCLNLHCCRLEGDVNVKGTVSVSRDSAICGNVIANELQCAGQITGDLVVTENTSPESTAKINGGIMTGTIAVVKGAVIKGSIEIKSSDT